MKSYEVHVRFYTDAIVRVDAVSKQDARNLAEKVSIRCETIEVPGEDRNGNRITGVDAEKWSGYTEVTGYTRLTERSRIKDTERNTHNEQ